MNKVENKKENIQSVILFQIFLFHVRFFNLKLLSWLSIVSNNIDLLKMLLVTPRVTLLVWSQFFIEFFHMICEM